jgi:hypothetical protein
MEEHGLQDAEQDDEPDQEKAKGGLVRELDSRGAAASGDVRHERPFHVALFGAKSFLSRLRSGAKSETVMKTAMRMMTPWSANWK